MQRRGGERGLGAVLFTDIVGSTSIAAELGNARWGELVARHHRLIRSELRRHGGREIDTAGDGFFATFDRPVDAIRCAVAAADAVRELGIEIRAGVSFGELETVGRKPGGLVVNTAARVMSVAGPGEVLVPAAVRDLVPGAGIAFADHGVHRLKGLDEELRLFVVTGLGDTQVGPPLDEAEAAARRSRIEPVGRRRTGAVIVGIAAASVAAVGIWLLVSGDEEEPPPRAATASRVVVELDPETGDALQTIDFIDPGRTPRDRSVVRVRGRRGRGLGGITGQLRSAGVPRRSRARRGQTSPAPVRRRPRLHLDGDRVRCALGNHRSLDQGEPRDRRGSLDPRHPSAQPPWPGPAWRRIGGTSGSGRPPAPCSS